MNMIGIIGAMEEEIQAIRNHMTGITSQIKLGLEFFSGELGGKRTVLVRSGIGKVNAAICTQDD